jgi:hypothetical protein
MNQDIKNISNDTVRIVNAIIENLFNREAEELLLEIFNIGVKNSNAKNTHLTSFIYKNCIYNRNAHRGKFKVPYLATQLWKEMDELLRNNKHQLIEKAAIKNYLNNVFILYTKGYSVRNLLPDYITGIFYAMDHTDKILLESEILEFKTKHKTELNVMHQVHIRNNLLQI